jgi:hypothetical protein
VSAAGMIAIGGGEAEARAVIIVAHDRLDLYDYLRRGLLGLGVAVILDSRLRMNELSTPGDSSTGSNGRWDPDIYDELLLRGFAIKRLD